MLSRRRFLTTSLVMAAAARSAAARTEPVIDIHQHTHYLDRTDEQLIAHQKMMGVTTTVLLPAGSKFGLDARCGGNETVLNLARAHKRQFVFFANEVTDLPEARAEIEKYLKKKARGIGEQKFHVDCDSPELQTVASIARDFRVPVLMHFQHETYNMGIERFHKVLEKFPTVNFIGHAQTWWGHVDKKHDPKDLYPKTRVEPGGLTDLLLSNYPNMFGDLSAGSGLNSMTRDEEHARWFLQKHHKQLLYGSDCPDVLGYGPTCTGSQILASVRRLVPDAKSRRRILHDNAKKLLRL